MFKKYRFFFTTIRDTSFCVKYSYLNLPLHDFRNIKEYKAYKLNQEESDYLYHVHDATKLSRTLKFSNFQEAFSFMYSCAILAEEMNHHPDLSNVYNLVKVDLNTHDVGGLSMKDFIFAFAMESIALQIQFRSVESLTDLKGLDYIQIINNWNHNYQNYYDLTKASRHQKTV